MDFFLKHSKEYTNEIQPINVIYYKIINSSLNV